ncbi:formylglycine-generating enzyme family protein [Glaciihabitans sp. UYNi722]|uniref:formylglycine-generating enzyme family protein n=1 Tax=Glaciihabitans sp. UYNi722 TaxID=3156344 RepID=UPI003395BCCE
MWNLDGDRGEVINDMVALQGGAFWMGSDFYLEEGPVHEEWVSPFELDRHAVTNAQFAEFVCATGYVTTAERPLDPAMFPGARLESLEPGSLVFTPTVGPVDLRDWTQWWEWTPGADWQHPGGPSTSLEGKGDHPVVQVAFEDANAFARWSGKRLPTEIEWEFAARGGLDQAKFAWGDEPNDGMRANSWQGQFPYLNRGAGSGSWVGTAPVGSFPPNDFGLHEMTGNTWEWTTTYWTDRLQDPVTTCACSPDSARSASIALGEATARRVLKGGSHLCAPEYCLRYRPAARSAQTEDSATTHQGFRCVR